ncbi:integrase [Mesorhizobium sp.]|uniref:integrase n=1 Tax=Mesorhizobium sp. TaxID=1871066 RepID=UPI00257EC32D|nr:integrase [Mesorhizobium sp.]
MIMPARIRNLSRFDPPQRVSSRSLWTDPQWHFDSTRPDLRSHQLLVDWAFELPDGSRFTDQIWGRWLQDARSFMWSLHVDPPPGRRQARPRSLVTKAVKLRVLIRWMTEQTMRGFDELDRDAAERFMHHVGGRRTHAGAPIRPSTRHDYANLLLALYQQRSKIALPPPEHPFGDERASRFSGFSAHTVGRLPFTPDAIAVPLVSAAIRLIGQPADDVIALRDQVVPFRMDDQGRSFFTHRQAVRNLVASFRFSAIDGEVRPWHAPLTRTKDLRLLINRIQEACFITIAYLVGARVSEILTLEANCIEEHPSADGSEAFAYLRGRIFKTAANEAGSPHLWPAPPPVLRAIEILHRLSEPFRAETGRSELWLSLAGSGIVDGRAPEVITASSLIIRLNERFAPFIDLPRKEDGSPWHLTTHQGRKTFARFVGKRDRTGLHALQHHFGHVTRIMTDSAYVGTDFDLGELVDAQTLEETRSALEELLTASRLGGKAGRLLSSRSRFRGRTRDGELAAYVDFLVEDSGMRLGVCDWGYCVYRAETAACIGDERGPNPLWRTESTCVSCANFAVTERHRPVWQARLERNLALIADQRLDEASLVLAKTRIAECERILSDLSATEESHGQAASRKPT